MLFFCNKTLTIHRFLVGELDHGTYTPGNYNVLTIRAGVQEVSPQQLALLEEGKRTRKSAYIVTEAELAIATQTTKPDWILIDNEWYEVESKAECTSDVINHFEYIALKIENPNDYDSDEAQ